MTWNAAVPAFSPFRRPTSALSRRMSASRSSEFPVTVCARAGSRSPTSPGLRSGALMPAASAPTGSGVLPVSFTRPWRESRSSTPGLSSRSGILSPCKPAGAKYCPDSQKASQIPALMPATGKPGRLRPASQSLARPHAHTRVRQSSTSQQSPYPLRRLCNA
jgi:hypothetical protein